MAWLRLYTDILNKPKISRLSDKQFRSWVELLLAAKLYGQGGQLPPMEDLCFVLRMEGKSRQMLARLEELKERKLVDQNADGVWSMHDWGTHQYTSDIDPTATERKRRERDRKNNVTSPVTLPVTRDRGVTSRPSETETEYRVQKTPQTPRGGGGAEVPERRRPNDPELQLYAEAWNAAGLPRYPRVPASFLTFPRPGEVAESVSWFKTDEVLAAIANYAEAVHNRDRYTWGATYANLANFLASGLPAFMPGTFETLKRPEPRPLPSDTKPELSRAPRPEFCSHCSAPRPAMGSLCTNPDCPTNNSDAAILSWVAKELV